MSGAAPVFTPDGWQRWAMKSICWNGILIAAAISRFSSTLWGLSVFGAGSREALMQISSLVKEQESLLGMSPHMLAIARK